MKSLAAAKLGRAIGDYNTTLVLIMGLSLGLMTYEQTSIGYLLPFIKPDLGLTNAEVGMLASAYWVTFAISSYAIGAWSDSRGELKKLLIAALIIFGVSSLLCSAVEQTSSLLLARALMGALAGALLTLIQSILGLSSTPERVGLNMGLVNGLGGNLFCLIIAPVAFVQIASNFGWRAGYFSIVVPAIICALLAAFCLREPKKGEVLKSRRATQVSVNALAALSQALQYRNIWLCAVLWSLFVAYASLAFTFIPLFLVEVRGFSADEMSRLMVVLGFSAIFFSVTLPVLSNRVGRRPVLVFSGVTSMLLPLAVCFYSGPVTILALLLFSGWAIAGTGPFFTGIIPTETVQSEIVSTSLGIIIALGVLVGGLAGPSIAGWAADRWGPNIPLLMQAVCAALVAVASYMLHETAPKVLQLRAKHAC